MLMLACSTSPSFCILHNAHEQPVGLLGHPNMYELAQTHINKVVNYHLHNSQNTDLKAAEHIVVET